MENKEVSNYIGLVTLMQASQGAEAGIIATSENFFGTDYVHKQMLGTDFAGAVTVSSEGTIYGYNNRSANAWKYEGEETVISDMKMINYFNGLARSGITDSISIYDRYREEYILTTWRKYTEQTIVESVGQLVSSVSLGMTFTGTIPVYDGLVTVKFSDGTTASGRVTKIGRAHV